MKEKPRLRKCPFCGRKPYAKPACPGLHIMYEISCHCGIPRVLRCSAETAATAWNRRGHTQRRSTKRAKKTGAGKGASDG
jgi:hypothetical protein